MAGSRAGLEGERCVRPLVYGEEFSRMPRSLFTFSDAQLFFYAFPMPPCFERLFFFFFQNNYSMLKSRLVYGLILFIFFFFSHVFFFAPRGRR